MEGAAEKRMTPFLPRPVQAVECDYCQFLAYRFHLTLAVAYSTTASVSMDACSVKLDMQPHLSGKSVPKYESACRVIGWQSQGQLIGISVECCDALCSKRHGACTAQLLDLRDF